MSVTTLPEALSSPARDFASRQQQLLIGGEHHPGADGGTFETLDPATGQAITRGVHRCPTLTHLDSR